jgi:hypothetical protein
MTETEVRDDIDKAKEAAKMKESVTTETELSDDGDVCDNGNRRQQQ